jgi:hypothetical protein
MLAITLANSTVALKRAPRCVTHGAFMLHARTAMVLSIFVVHRNTR